MCTIFFPVTGDNFAMSIKLLALQYACTYITAAERKLN